MQGPAEASDRRVLRTRKAIVDAFVRMVLERRYDRIQTMELIEAAGVGRSTFYEHFRGKDDVLLTAIRPMLLPLANAATGRAPISAVQTMLQHLWQQRAFGRVILASRTGQMLERELAKLIAARLEELPRGTAPLSMRAMAAAAGQLAMLRMWLAGEAYCSTEALARQMMADGTSPARSKRAQQMF